MQKVLAIIPVLNIYPEETIKSLNSQTLKPARIIVVAGSRHVYEKCKEKGIESVFVKPDFTKHLSIRVAKSINIALRSLNVSLEEYDYILKVDGDTILPSKFIELCIAQRAHCVGGSGYVELFSVRSFIELFGGKFPEVTPEDTYMEFSVLASGKKFVKWPIKPIHRGDKKRHNWQYYYEGGVGSYKLGYDPIHILCRLRHGKMYAFYIIGYFLAMFQRVEKYQFAPKIFRLKLKELPNQLKLFMQGKLDFR